MVLGAGLPLTLLLLLVRQLAQALGSGGPGQAQDDGYGQRSLEDTHEDLLPTQTNP